MKVSAGISHHISNLTAMLREANFLGRTLIVPKFNLDPIHNLGRPIKSHLDEYYDFEHVAVNDQPVRIVKRCPDEARSKRYVAENWNSLQIVLNNGS